MTLATTTVENVDRFLDVFGTKGAEKRALHGSKGSTVFRDPTEENRVWALFDWDEQGWASFVSDPEVPPILKEAGHWLDIMWVWDIPKPADLELLCGPWLDAMGESGAAAADGLSYD